MMQTAQTHLVFALRLGFHDINFEGHS
jgi:hypothetical protein